MWPDSTCRNLRAARRRWRNNSRRAFPSAPETAHPSWRPRNSGAPGAPGPGHYGAISADSVFLDETLETELLYGFTHAPGDTFTLISASTSLTGQFVGLPEGAVAARFSEVELTISYAANHAIKFLSLQARPFLHHGPGC